MIKIHVFHTGKVYVSHALPFKDKTKNPIDCVIMSHLHSDHASALKRFSAAKKILVSAEELNDTKKFPIRYVSSMWDGINFIALSLWQIMIPMLFRMK